MLSAYSYFLAVIASIADRKLLVVMFMIDLLFVFMILWGSPYRTNIFCIDGEYVYRGK